MASNESPDRLIGIESRLEALDRKLDQRFAAIDARFDNVDERFDKVDERFDKEHSHFDALYEASRSDFNNLYDFVQAVAQATDARFDRLDNELAKRFADVYAAIAVSRRASR
jgi:hypothetical protein